MGHAFTIVGLACLNYTTGPSQLLEKKNNNTHLLHINNHDARPNITVGFKLMHEEGDTWKTTAHYYVFGH